MPAFPPPPAFFKGPFNNSLIRMRETPTARPRFHAEGVPAVNGRTGKGVRLKKTLPQGLKGTRSEGIRAMRSVANCSMPTGIGVAAPANRSSTGKKHEGMKVGLANSKWGNRTEKSIIKMVMYLKSHQNRASGFHREGRGSHSKPCLKTGERIERRSKTVHILLQTGHIFIS